MPDVVPLHVQTPGVVEITEFVVAVVPDQTHAPTPALIS